ncbi:MAG: 6-carboxytetrahydropterin synthase [Myxococcales bacterium]|nr:6-carboxytetrahydropterin synthase [Myxococcales bacterium]
MRISRKIHFCAGRRYQVAALGEGENERLFGLSARAPGHGHNFTCEVVVSGPIDPATGMVMNLTALDAAMRDVIEPLDHKMLHVDIPHFREVVPTDENIAVYVWDQLKGRLPAGCRLAGVRIFEDPLRWAEYAGDEGTPS